MADHNKGPVGKDGPFPMETAKSGGGPPSGPKLVRSVDSADAKKVAMNKVSVVINAAGTVPATNWKNARLEPVVYIQPPPDHIYDFSFVADIVGVGNDVLTKVNASYTWNHPAPDAVGVRILAATNKLEAKIK